MASCLMSQLIVDVMMSDCDAMMMSERVVTIIADNKTMRRATMESGPGHLSPVTRATKIRRCRSSDNERANPTFMEILSFEAVKLLWYLPGDRGSG